MRITSVRSTYCFVRLEDARLAQVVRVAVEDAPAGAEARASLAGPELAYAGTWRGRLDVSLAGRDGGPAWAPAADPGLMGPARFTPATEIPAGPVLEVPVVWAEGTRPGQKVWTRATVEVAGSVAQAEAELVVREPGWRMVMVAHFHYDPVWWNTQAGYTSGWDELLWALERRETFQHTGLALVEAHLQRARLDPRYKFVLAEVDYLQPFWDLYPDRRGELRALLRDGRLEIVGGTYNEPNTNLTGAETAIRAAVYGLGFQRDVMGADPKSAWQLDVFGHDPSFPGIMAACGLGSSSWARGPFHQWGPRRHVGSNSWMQFPSEFEWVAPNGLGLLTSYMPNHYSAGWELEKATTLEGAMWQAYELFCDLAEVSATKVTLLPVGTDYTPPGRFAADLAEAWNARYASPRFELGLPKEFFAAVRAELEATGRAASPQSRDMNPIYTGKDVSFIDTKQAQRLAEVWLAEAESMAAISCLLGGEVPWRSLDKAWRQLVFGAHHDGITGSESDQVYLDLLGGWREAYQLARRADTAGRAQLVGAIDTRGEGEAVIVTNTLGVDRSELVSLEVAVGPGGEVMEVVDEAGTAVPSLEEPGTRASTRAITFPASEVPGVGYKTFRLRRRPGAGEGWSAAPGLVISNEVLEVMAGEQGGLARIVERESGFSLLPAGEVAGELLVYPEYANHPSFGEGPWNLLPSGPPARSGAAPASVRREHSALGERLVIEGTVPGEGFSYRQVATLWRGSRRLGLRTEVHGWHGRDRLLRLRFPTALAGATPVSAVGGAVVARGFGLIDVDSAKAPWTLDNPAAEWFGLSTALVVEAVEPGAGAAGQGGNGEGPGAGGPAYHERSVGVAEIVAPAGQSGAPWARELVVALLRRGVTATCSDAGANRYGALLGDSNLPDFRIAVGGPWDNSFVAEVLSGAAGAPYRNELEAQLARQGTALVLVPAERPLSEVWVPNADLRGARALPVLVVAAAPGAGSEAPGEAAGAGTGADAGGARGSSRHGGTAAAVARLVAQVASGRVRVSQPRALVALPERVPSWTAAILNRGTPGFVVDTSGAMYVSVLRACTGWPSGVWIDPPRRSVPDGSAFELEHWSHVFEHALVIGRGSWREAGIAEEAQAYNRPLVATLAEPHDGPLPTTCRLFGISRVAGASPLLAALKPAGNPLASGDLPGAGPGGEDITSGAGVGGSQAGAGGDRGSAPAGVEVALRCYEVSGSPAEVEVTSVFPLLGARRADLVEKPGEELALWSAGPGDGGGTSGAGGTGDGHGAGGGRAGAGADGGGDGHVAGGAGPAQAVRLTLGPGELSTLRLRLAPAAPAGVPSAGPRLDEVEPAQPVFSRYWLHNRGAAPLGNQGVAVHVLATSVVVRAGDSFELVVQVASGAARSVRSGRVELVAPEGWYVEPPSQLFSLAPGAFLKVPSRVSVPGGLRPGRRFVAARVVDDAGQVQEDVATVDVLPPLTEAALAGGKALPSPMNAGPMNAGPMNAGPMNAGPMNAGPMNAGPMNAGPMNAGPMNPGPMNPGPMNAALPFGHPSPQLPAELELSVEAGEVALAAGETTTLALRLRNRTCGELRGEAQLLSPVETWPLIGAWHQGFVVGPGEERLLEATVEGPLQGWLESWALWKVTYFGRLWYSPAVALRLGAPARAVARAAEGEETGELAGAKRG
jgi:alpha-mannosidase